VLCCSLSEKEFWPAEHVRAVAGVSSRASSGGVCVRENYEQLWHLQEEGRAEAEVSIEGSLSGKPCRCTTPWRRFVERRSPMNLSSLARTWIPGNLGTGATDNGTGSMAVLAAARALQKVGVRPKRTIRFVLFTGEEQGLNGSRAYVKAHKDELPKISGVLVHDTGTGKVLTIGLMGNYGARETIDHALYPLAKAKDIGLVEPTLRREGGSDHVPFDEAGVRASGACKDVADYETRCITPSRTGWSTCVGMTCRRRAGAGGVCVQRGAVAGAVAEEAGEREKSRSVGAQPASTVG